MKNSKQITLIFFFFSLFISSIAFTDERMLTFGSIPQSQENVTYKQIVEQLISVKNIDISKFKIKLFFKKGDAIDASIGETFTEFKSKKGIKELNEVLKESNVNIYYSLSEKKVGTLAKMMKGISNFFSSSVEPSSLNCSNKTETYGERIRGDEREDYVGPRSNLGSSLGSGIAAQEQYVRKNRDRVLATLSAQNPDKHYTRSQVEGKLRQAYYGHDTGNNDFVLSYDWDRAMNSGRGLSLTRQDSSSSNFNYRNTNFSGSLGLGRQDSGSSFGGGYSGGYGRALTRQDSGSSFGGNYGGGFGGGYSRSFGGLSRQDSF